MGRTLDESTIAKVAEVALVAVVAFVTTAGGWALVGDDAFARQAVVWIANVLMLLLIWLGLHVRGETWAHLGLSRPRGARALLRTVLQALAVLAVSLVAFAAGGALMSRWGPGSATSADMSGYAYLQGNFPMLVLALAGVYVVSSFGEEVIYRGFLMNRFVEMRGNGRPAWTQAVLVSAALFGLVHFSWGIVGVVQTTLLGLALAIAYLAAGRNLWVLILAHACLDSLLLIQLYMGPEVPR